MGQHGVAPPGPRQLEGQRRGAHVHCMKPLVAISHPRQTSSNDNGKRDSLIRLELFEIILVPFHPFLVFEPVGKHGFLILVKVDVRGGR